MWDAELVTEPVEVAEAQVISTGSMTTGSVTKLIINR